MTYPYVAGAVLLASDLNTDFAAKTDTAMVQNAQTGTSYSYALADASKLLTMSNAASNTVLVTKQATVTWVTGTQLRVINLGAGVTTLVADTGVTINGNVALNQYQGGTLIRTASDVWLFVPTASGSGMDLITPTSVVNATLLGGKVTFSAAATVSINGCFTSAYDSYDLVWYSTNATDQEIRFRMRLAGSDNSAASYDYQWTLAGSSTISTSRSTAQAQGLLVRNLSTTSAATMRITAPALAANTVSRVYAMAHTGINVYDIANNHAVATAYDGITLIPSTGTLTGTVRIYGLRNS